MLCDTIIYVILALLFGIWCYVLNICYIGKITNDHFDIQKNIFAGGMYKVCKNNKYNQIIQILNESASKNFVFSPRSLDEALALLYIGSINSAQKQLQEYFCDGQPNDIMSYYKKWDTELSKNNIKIGNSIWADTTVGLRTDYMNTVKPIANVYLCNFIKDNVQNKINSWISKKTDDMIKTIPFRKDSAINIINAIYFYGLWKFPFKTEDTKQEQFFIKKSDFIFVDMMHKKINIPFYKDPVLTAINLPYKGPYSMILTINTTSDNQFFKTDELTKLMTKMETHYVTVKIPRFTCEYEIDLVKPLKQAGFADIFTPNYSNMSTDPSIFVGSIIQKIKIEVNESGTRAAAATVISMDRELSSDEYLFIGNVPFNYYIIYTPTNEILFLGNYKGK